MRKRVKPKQQWLFWCLGSIMLANIFAYFGVAYWDQTQVWWFALLAMICAVTVPHVPHELTKTGPAVSEGEMIPDLVETAPEARAAVLFPGLRKTVRLWGGPEL
jgi:hypothetical protein